MKTLILAVAAIVAMCVAVPSVEAHHGNGVVVTRGGVVRGGGFHHGNVVVDGRGVVVARGGGVVVRRGGFFNRDGGPNRFGFRR